MLEATRGRTCDLWSGLCRDMFNTHTYNHIHRYVYPMYFLRGHPSKKVGFLMMTWKYPAIVYPYSNSLSEGRIEEKLLKWLGFFSATN